MVVDDEPAVAHMFRDIVTSLGYDSEIARLGVPNSAPGCVSTGHDDARPPGNCCGHAMF